MTPDPPDPIRELLERIRTFLGNHERLRDGVGIVGRTLAAFAEWSAPAPAETPAEPPAEVPAEPSVPEPPAAAPPESVVESVPPPAPAPLPPPVPIASLPRLTFKPPPPLAEPVSNAAIAQQPLPLTAARCRLKAEAARLVVRRLSGERGLDDAVDLLRRANELGDCFLWMLNSQGLSERPGNWNDLASAFEAAADAAEMFQLWREAPEPDARRFTSDILHLAAEAQAVLYAAVVAVGRPKTDGDQLNLFISIREEAEDRQVFVTRFLKREDVADPASASSVARRVAEQIAAVRRISENIRQRQKLLRNLGYKARRLADDPVGLAGEWPRVIEMIDELVAGRLPPSNAEMRDHLLPIFDLLPDDLPLTPNATLVFREIERYLALRAEAEPRTTDAPAETPSAELVAAANLLRGKEVMLIGGLCRPDAKAALIRALGLADLHWKSTEEHESTAIFEAGIARPEVAVVLLAIRWSSHSYGDVQTYCDRYGKLLVRLPGGYHPNQVAHQILSQVGERLRIAV